ncbi:hypothetical protein [Limnofasciculus baicalensis]|uniref:Uncharacterized protein n=1 Tax=Limnofasciculus baicalensis BBK-W-15 TaxID=2699891 RepID=A0AAE3GX87_9CYAN|nr:hypothetical protein [Limnofasciculus baicalensis]MCP2730297.1 hypothetical protein [Limnofasciculus baicalensis BBK-W-15]
MISLEIEPGEVFWEKIVDAKGESAKISGEKFIITLVRIAHPTVIERRARS